jgi:hypothetical protein
LVFQPPGPHILLVRGSQASAGNKEQEETRNLLQPRIDRRSKASLAADNEEALVYSKRAQYYLDSLYTRRTRQPRAQSRTKVNLSCSLVEAPLHVHSDRPATL